PPGHLSILLLTMQTRTEQIVEGLGAGANDYLVKPYADPELRARMDALVRWCRLRDRAQRAEASVVGLVQHAPDPLIGLGPQNRIPFVNEEAQRVLGQSAAGLKSKTLLDVLPTLALDEAALAGPDT